MHRSDLDYINTYDVKRPTERSQIPKHAMMSTDVIGTNIMLLMLLSLLSAVCVHVCVCARARVRVRVC